jgi:hypothetical protein
LVLDLTNEELAMTRWSRWSETHQDLHYIIYNKTKGKFKGDSAISYNMLQYTFTYRPKIKDIYEETINKISNENIRDLMRDYIIRENALRLAIEDYNYYKIKSTRPFLEKHDLFNLDEAFKDESYDNSRSRSLELINSDKLEEHFNSGEFNSIIVQLRLHTSWVIQNFQIMKEFNQRLKLELENEIRKE